MSFLLAAIAVGALCASAGGGFLFAARRRPGDPGPHGDGEGVPKKGDRRDDRGSSPRRSHLLKRAFEALPFALGDVVVADREERWLAGGLLAKEGDKVVAAIFFAPEGAKITTVAAFARPRRDVWWLAPASVDSPSEPPASIEIDGAPMTRRARLPVSLSSHGQGVPTLADSGILAEYDGSADDVAILLTSGGRAFAWRGRKLDEGTYDRLGSGGED